MTFSIIPVLAAVLIAGSAAATPQKAETQRAAARAFREAELAFGRRQFREAAAAFERAAKLAPHPSALLNAAEAWERAGELVRAAESCDGVLAMPRAAEQFRAEARRRLSRLAPKTAVLDLRGPQNLSVRIDRGPRLSVPSENRVLPGRHTLYVTGRGERTVQIRVDVGAGQTKVVDL